MRVIVTGSRDADEAEVYERLETLYRAGQLGVKGQIIIVQGGCPTGADHAALLFAQDHGLAHETFAADWDRHGTAAGPIRNGQMAQAGANMCYAYPLREGDSRGTWDCVRACVKCGIEVRVRGVQRRSS